MDWIKDIKVVIFDMDGTLYQEDTYLGRFLTYMLENQYSDEQINKVVEEAYDILKGKHFVNIGHYYDFTKNRILTHNELTPNFSYSWEGQKLESEQEHSSDIRLFYIGDPWEIAFMLGKKLGISEEIKTNAFNRVRAEMLTSEYAIPKSELLIEALKNINVDSKILITNSPFESGEVFLEYLEVLPYFDETIYDGKKPGGTEKIIKKLMEKGYEPKEILSIGDNPKNDLYPARKIGARTVFISDYQTVDQTPWDYKVKNIDELVLFLQQLQMKSAEK